MGNISSQAETSASSAPHVPGASAARLRYEPIVDLQNVATVAWGLLPPSPVAPGGRQPFAPDELRRALPPDGSLLVTEVDYRQLDDPAFVQGCVELAGRLVLEVPAHLLQGVELTPVFEALTAEGIHLSVCDASQLPLPLLADIAPAFLTLGEATAKAASQDPSTRGIVAGLVSFAESIEAHVLVRGVDHREQVLALRDVGVEFGRGSAFGRPTTTWEAPKLRAAPTRLPLGAAPADREFASADDVYDVAHTLVAEIAARPGADAAVYIERDGVLRCLAHGQHSVVLDGVPVRSAQLAPPFRTGREDRILSTGTTTDDGHVVVVQPIVVGDRTVGILRVRASSLAPADEQWIASLRRAAEQRLAVTGVHVHETPLSRVTRAMTELSVLTDVPEVELAAARLAVDVSGLSSGLLALPTAEGSLERTVAQGPLSADLRRLAPDALGAVLAEIASASCSYLFRGDGTETITGRVRSALGASTLLALPVRSDERGTGLLLLVDHGAVQLSHETREAVELLARDIAQTLDDRAVVDDLRTKATIDTLTGLGNLAAFHAALDAMAARRRGRWALAMADVDGLKRVNDTHGHLTGDLALRSLAGALEGVLRSEDRIFRIGGDEFAALLLDVDGTGAAEVGRRMVEAADSVISYLGAGLSVGIAIPEPGETSSDFIDWADKMLYEVKRSGRNAVRVAPPRNHGHGTHEPEDVQEVILEPQRHPGELNLDPVKEERPADRAPDDAADADSATGTDHGNGG